MNSQTALRTTGSQQVYHLGTSRFLYPAILLALVLVLGVGLQQPFDPRLALICTAAFLVIFGIAALLLYDGIRLVVSDEGIEYRNMGFHVDSLARITLRRSATEALLRRDGLQTSGWFRVGMALLPATSALRFVSGHGYRSSTVDMSVYSHAIPVGHFSGWKRGSLREEIQRRAPQAFSTNRAEPPAG
jgi:hypothetical protein